MLYQLNDGAEDVLNAKALLSARCRGLNVRETDICEKIASLDGEDAAELFTMNKNEWLRFNSLKVEFSREIAQWKEGK